MIVKKKLKTTKNSYKSIELPPKYSPKKSEEYMCDLHKAFFYRMLIDQKEEIQTEIADEIEDVNIGKQIESGGAMDELDAATLSIEADLNIKMQERHKNLLVQINNALARLKDGTYGYSVISGDEIGLKRLIIQPIATLTIEEESEAERKA